MQISNISVSQQFGFRSGTSTEIVTFKLTDKILKAINKKAGIFCDPQKSFHSVHHEIS
jgi:hypothetical protein